MGNFRPLATKWWKAFLKMHGYTYDRTMGSHFQWIKPGKRTIPVREAYKIVPPQHLKTGCLTLGVAMADMYSWAEKNC